MSIDIPEHPLMTVELLKKLLQKYDGSTEVRITIAEKGKGIESKVTAIGRSVEDGYIILFGGEEITDPFPFSW